MIDLVELFTEHGIRYWLKGKNCSEGWVNIQCPLCNDHSNHMGINLMSSVYHCWHCDGTGHFQELLPDLLNCSQHEANKIIYEFVSEDVISIPREKREPEQYRDILPKESTNILPETHRQYLVGRRFSPEFIKMRYKIKACDRFGAYKFRIIIPVIVDGLIVQFTSMAIAGQEPRYRHCPNEKALADIKSCLYNIDAVEDTVIITEGVTDVWRLGDGAVCTFGTMFTDTQINVLAKRVQRAFVMFDSEEKDSLAPTRAEKLADQLSVLIPHTEVFYLDRGDPADMLEEEVLLLRKEVGL